MEVKQILAVVRSWGWLVVVATVLAGGVSYWSSLSLPPLYRASTTLMVGRFIDSRDPTTAELQLGQQLAQSYVQLVGREQVLQATCDALGLNISWHELARLVNARAVPNSQLMQITVVDTFPERAQAIANEVAHQLILHSPTTPQGEQEAQRQFVAQQIADLQTNIEVTQGQIEELEARLARESSAQVIQELQNQIDAQQQKILTWQSTYAELLNFQEGSRTNYLSVVDSAVAPKRPFSPDPARNSMLAASIGFLLSLASVVVIVSFDDTVKSSEQVRRALKLPVLGLVSSSPHNRLWAQHVGTGSPPAASVVEEYRALRMNIQVATQDSASTTFIVASPLPAEGKSTIASNLAVALTAAGKTVLLVDADMRHPSLHKFFDVANQTGLSDLLSDTKLPMDAAVIQTKIPGLRLIPSGSLANEPAELLDLPAMKRRLEEMRERADLVVLDSPPVLATADTLILGALAGTSVLFVTRAGRTRTSLLQRAKATLEQVHAQLLGVIITNLPSRNEGYHYGSYAGSPQESAAATVAPPAVSKPKPWALNEKWNRRRGVPTDVAKGSGKL